MKAAALTCATPCGICLINALRAPFLGGGKKTSGNYEGTGSLSAAVKRFALPAALRPSKPGVIITIDREHGSSGKLIGQLIAEKLGVPFYYKEMIALAAEESGLAKEFISGINEAEPGALHGLYISSEPVQQAIIAQEKIIRAIAENGSCVIVGRAAGFVLQDFDNAVNIFIHAPEAYRAAQVMKQNPLRGFCLDLTPPTRPKSPRFSAFPPKMAFPLNSPKPLAPPLKKCKNTPMRQQTAISGKTTPKPCVDRDSLSLIKVLWSTVNGG